MEIQTNVNDLALITFLIEIYPWVTIQLITFSLYLCWNINSQNNKAISLVQSEVCDKVYLFRSTSKSGSSLTFGFTSV